MVLILYFALALVISFLCSLLEAVLLSISHAYIGTLKEQHPGVGRILKGLKEHINRPLAAILTLNTVANTVGAAGVGAKAFHIWGNKYVALVSGILTFSILVFSEIIPKTLGAVHWRILAAPAAYAIWALIHMLYPLVRLFEFISRLLAGKHRRVRLSREEMVSAVQIGHKDGTLHAEESRIINNILHLRNIRVKDILTPRSVMLAFRQDQSVTETLEKNSPIPFGRIPIYGKDLDDITGIVHRYKIVQAQSQGQGQLALKAIASDIYAIPETKCVADTLDEFIKRRKHIFLVVDEHGGTAGIITLEDAIETLLGVEIVDEFDTVEDMRQWALQQWQKRKRDANVKSTLPPER